MKINELIVEGKWASDFNRYRQMGQNPSQLATHAVKKVAGAASGNSTAEPQVKKSLGDTAEIKSILDNVIAGKTLDSQSLQTLKQFRKKL